MRCERSPGAKQGFQTPPWKIRVCCEWGWKCQCQHFPGNVRFDFPSPHLPEHPFSGKHHCFPLVSTWSQRITWNTSISSGMGTCPFPSLLGLLRHDAAPQICPSDCPLSRSSACQAKRGAREDTGCRRSSAFLAAGAAAILLLVDPRLLFSAAFGVMDNGEHGP